MADTVTHAKNGAKTLRKILLRLKHNDIGSIRKRLWVSSGSDPAVDAGSQGSYPMKVGDFCYRSDSDEVFICSVKVTANTAATVIQLHA